MWLFLGGISVLWLSCKQDHPLIDLPLTERLVSADLFVKRSLHPDMIFIDCRPSQNFIDGHLPGAINIWRDELTDSIGLMLPKEQIEHVLGSKGLTSNHTFILYDDRGSCEAARLWWVMTYYGFNNMFILDGGIDYWKHLDLPIESGDYKKLPTTFDFKQEINRTHYIDHKQLIEEIGTNIVLIDTRSEAEFNGIERKGGAIYAGRIPGSIHLDYTESVYMDSPHGKRFKSKPELLQIFEEAGIFIDDTIVTYCHSGTRSAHTTFVLTEILGFKNVRNYDGSWMEWTRIHPPSL